MQFIQRKSIRLKQYDYSKQGMYFITICTQNRECILSNIENVGTQSFCAQIKLTPIGEKIEEIYLNLEKEFQHIKLQEYVFMPNHIHGIIEICKRADTRPAPTICDIICSFKSRTTCNYIKKVKQGIWKSFNRRIWQRNYYEHIIRNEKEYMKICEYIKNKPSRWKDDKLNN